ncbi:MAG: hypothetical protein SF162_00860 [bacterium]|nr:hypothetical protein [bacterium]
MMHTPEQLMTQETNASTAQFGSFCTSPWTEAYHHAGAGWMMPGTAPFQNAEVQPTHDALVAIYNRENPA